MILISTVTCGRNKSIQLDQQDLIRFGHGGGIFGREYVFFLKRDGSIFGPDTKPVQLSANQLKQVIKNIGFLNFAQTVIINLEIYINSLKLKMKIMFGAE